MSNVVQLPKYAQCQPLQGCSGPVNVLLFSTDGKLLISGGDDERVRVWNTTTFRSEITLSQKAWAQITCLTCIHVDSPVSDKCTILAVGTGRGTVTLCLMIDDAPFVSLEARTTTTFKFNNAVEAMAHDRINSKLAVTSHSGDITVYAVDKLVLTPIWTKDMQAAIPRAVFFHGPANSLLLILGLETGDIYCREVDSAQVLWKKTLDGPIGNAALSLDHSTLIVDNLLDQSFDVYSFPSVARPATLAFSDQRRYPRQCTFSETAKVAVCGSTINKVYVVDITTNEILQTLRAGDDNSMLQAVAATASNRHGALIAGGSDKGTIYLWKRAVPEKQEQAVAASGDSTHQTGVAASPDPINLQVVLLIFILTCGSWYPYIKQVAISAYERLMHLYAHLLALSDQTGSGHGFA